MTRFPISFFSTCGQSSPLFSLPITLFFIDLGVFELILLFHYLATIFQRPSCRRGVNISVSPRKLPTPTTHITTNTHDSVMASPTVAPSAVSSTDVLQA